MIAASLGPEGWLRQDSWEASTRRLLGVEQRSDSFLDWKHGTDHARATLEPRVTATEFCIAELSGLEDKLWNRMKEFVEHSVSRTEERRRESDKRQDYTTNLYTLLEARTSALEAWQKTSRPVDDRNGTTDLRNPGYSPATLSQQLRPILLKAIRVYSRSFRKHILRQLHICKANVQAALAESRRDVAAAQDPILRRVDAIENQELNLQQSIRTAHEAVSNRLAVVEQHLERRAGDMARATTAAPEPSQSEASATGDWTTPSSRATAARTEHHRLSQDMQMADPPDSGGKDVRIVLHSHAEQLTALEQRLVAQELTIHGAAREVR